MKELEVKIDKEILLRFLSGSGSEEDRKIILEWLQNPVNNHEIVEESLKYWDSINTEEFILGYNGDSLLDRIHHLIKLEEGTFITKAQPKIRFITYFTRIAAIIALPLLIASLFFYSQNRSLQNTLSWAEINVPFGIRTDFQLPDGSKVKLNGGSSLKFPAVFKGKTRDIKLTGEAYFEVVSNKKKPFIVSTGNIDVKVTGTSFNIMAYSNDPVTEVTLKSGVVEVFTKKNGETESCSILKPNDLFIYNSLTNSEKIDSINTADKLSWLEGKMTFRYESFKEVVQKLNRWYNVNIIIKDKELESYIYYGTFQNETIDEVLKLLQYTAPIKYKDYPREQYKDGTFQKRMVELYYKI